MFTQPAIGMAMSVMMRGVRKLTLMYNGVHANATICMFAFLSSGNLRVADEIHCLSGPRRNHALE